MTFLWKDIAISLTNPDCHSKGDGKYTQNNKTSSTKGPRLNLWHNRPLLIVFGLPHKHQTKRIILSNPEKQAMEHQVLTCHDDRQTLDKMMPDKKVLFLIKSQS